MITAAGVWSAYRLVDVIAGYLERKALETENRFDDMLVPLLRRTLKIFVLIAGLVYVASQWSDDLWSVVAGLSIGSLAVGFAARDSIENLLGTFTVLLDKPFGLGDYIKMGEVEGTAEIVGFRSTRLRTPADSLITVPNRRFISDSVENLGARRWRRTRTTLGLTCDTPPALVEAFCEGVRELIRRQPSTRKDLYLVYFQEFGASSLDVGLEFYLEAPDLATECRERHRLLSAILSLAERLRVSFAFPTRTIVDLRQAERLRPESPGTAEEGLRRGRRAAEELAGAPSAAPDALSFHSIESLSAAGRPGQASAGPGT